MLNSTQQRIFEYLLDRLKSGVPPTVREIGASVGLKSTSSVQANLDALEREGFIERDPLRKRTIRIAGQTNNVRNIPILGTVTAGVPIEAIEQIDGYLPFDVSDVTSDKELFALHVCGDSMINAGIYDGDVIVVEKTPTANNGEIVVAMIENEATVKTFFKEHGHFRLQPENDLLDPIIADDVVILGKVIALHRYY